MAIQGKIIHRGMYQGPKNYQKAGCDRVQNNRQGKRTGNLGHRAAWICNSDV